MAAPKKPRGGSREMFLRYYVEQGCTNQFEAFRRAGFATKGSRHGVQVNASKILNEPAMQARLKVLLQKQLEQADITAERVMMELARRAFADVRALFDAEGKLLPIHEIDSDAAASIDGIEFDIDKDGRPTAVRVKRAGKDASLSVLARHFRIAGHEIDEAVGKLATFAERLTAAREREKKLRK